MSCELKNILLIAEHHHQQLHPAMRHLLQAAVQISTEITVLVVGEHCDPVVTQLQSLPFIQRIVVVDHPVYAYQLAENVSKLIALLSKDYAYILASSSTFSKNILPRVAALCDVGMISDMVQIISADTFVRPIYAGNALATVKSLDSIKIATVRSTAFSTAEGKNNKDVIIEKREDVIVNTQSQFESETVTRSSRPELAAARIVVSGGRGLKTADHVKALQRLADCLGAGVGGSRAAVDAGLLPNDCQVGQTGKVVAPDLYIAVGISGAIQHIAGMKDSKVIVAINNDPEAPIFQIADYGLVGDLVTILPLFCEELEK